MSDKLEDLKLMIKNDRRIWAIGGFIGFVIIMVMFSSKSSGKYVERDTGKSTQGSLVAEANEGYSDLVKAFREEINEGKLKQRDIESRLERSQRDQHEFQNQVTGTIEVVANQINEIAQQMEALQNRGPATDQIPTGADGTLGGESDGLEPIGFENTDVPAPPPAPARPTRVSVITPGDSVEVELLTGVNAPVDGTPYPVVFKISGEISGPDGSALSVGEARLLAAAQGSEVDGRALFRLTQLSIRHHDGRRSVIDVDGWIIGEDGIRGMRGKLIDKLGKLILATAGVSFAAGVADSVDQKNRGNQSFFSNNESGVDISGDDIDFGAASAFTDASNRLGQVLIDRYEKLVPVVEVLPGRKVAAVFSRTSEIEILEEDADEGIYAASLD